MSQPKLFTPLRIRNLELENRIVIAPMCQYSAEEGCMTDWHTLHLGQLAQSGAGLLTIEAAAVSPEGRITYADVGLYDDKTEEAMGRVLATIRKWSNIPVGIQLAHAGRKASTYKPWDKQGQIPPDQEGGWQTLAPSAVPYSEGYTIPTALDSNGLAEIRNQFAEAAKRAARLNIDLIQIHAAHGYLLHQFLSPLSNQRTDNYGGSLENRARFPLEIVDAVREAFPADKPSACVSPQQTGSRAGLTLRKRSSSRRCWKPVAWMRFTFPAAACIPTSRLMSTLVIKCRWQER